MAALWAKSDYGAADFNESSRVVVALVILHDTDDGCMVTESGMHGKQKEEQEIALILPVFPAKSAFAF
jgi:hypothetical protein